MRVRFAPSPTGALHIGGARTALFNWLLARHYGGELVLRIEDTDRERSTPENIEQILDALRWLELDWDEGPILQTARSERHGEALEALLESGHAYRSNATADDVKAFKDLYGADEASAARRESEGAVRLRVPDEGATVVHDVIRGDTRFEHVHLDDPVIARADGSVLYNFAVAIDDLDAASRTSCGARTTSRTRPSSCSCWRPRGRRAWARRAAAGLRAPAAAARPRRQEALQAPRRGLRAGAARRGLPAGGGPQLPRAARLGRRRRRDGALDRRADRALHARARQPQPGALRRGQAALAQRRVHPQTARRRSSRGALGSVHRARRSRRSAAAISQEKIQTLADFWPLAGSLLDGPADDPEARERWLDEEGRAALAAGARRARAAPRFDDERSSARSRRGRARARQAAPGLPAAARGVVRLRRCRRGSSRALRCSGARRRCAGSTRAVGAYVR